MSSQPTRRFLLVALYFLSLCWYGSRMNRTRTLKAAGWTTVAVLGLVVAVEVAAAWVAATVVRAMEDLENQ